MNPERRRSRPRKLKRVGPGVQAALYPIEGHGLFKVTLTYLRGQPVVTIDRDEAACRSAAVDSSSST